MKKLFATALMAMSMGSVFAQDNIVANDTVKTDTTKNCPAKVARNHWLPSFLTIL